ncbi:hypothetical protein [Methylobacterium sp. WL120]|uniref:hypothetical protein n=1 Tax=Methylobacterium sp. WL120 TaxID=2603887 RepID=UPI0011C7E520|nr:hypothetical protein [Methylobacterium sp. WL120]TXM70414.1 hypothetical protein FV229_02365 [Methylobacterium sp. WL120]
MSTYSADHLSEAGVEVKTVFTSRGRGGYFAANYDVGSWGLADIFHGNIEFGVHAHVERQRANDFSVNFNPRSLREVEGFPVELIGLVSRGSSFAGGYRCLCCNSDRLFHVVGLLLSEVSQISRGCPQTIRGDVETLRIKNEEQGEYGKQYVSNFYFIKEALPPIMMFFLAIAGIDFGGNVMVKGDGLTGWRRAALWGLSGIIGLGSFLGLFLGMRLLSTL